MLPIVEIKKLPGLLEDSGQMTCPEKNTSDDRADNEAGRF